MESHEYVPADPFFSFHIHWASGWETKLGDATAVAAERDAFTSEFEKLNEAFADMIMRWWRGLTERRKVMPPSVATLAALFFSCLTQRRLIL